jgi:hypothetical protein
MIGRNKRTDKGGLLGEHLSALEPLCPKIDLFGKFGKLRKFGKFGKFGNSNFRARHRKSANPKHPRAVGPHL